jgi:hypothetical protein
MTTIFELLDLASKFIEKVFRQICPPPKKNRFKQERKKVLRIA